jgi:O-antigen/teichoic acid export membrane protein
LKVSTLASWWTRVGPSGPLFAARLSGLLASVVTALLLSAGLTPEQRGTVATFAILQMIAAIAAGFGTGVAAYVLVGEDPERADRVSGAVLAWASIVLLTSLVAATLLESSGLLRVWLGSTSGKAPIVPLLAIGSTGQYLSLTFTQLGAGVSRTSYVATGFVLSPLAIMAGTLVAFLGRSDATGYMFVQAIAWIGSGAILVLAFRGTPRPTLRQLPHLLERGKAAAAGDIANALSYRLDTLLLGLITGPAAVGIYSLAVQVLEPMWIVATAVSNGLLIRYPITEVGRWVRDTKRAAVVVLALTALGVSAALLALPEVLSILRPAYSPTTTVALALGPGIIFLAGSKVLASYQVASGRLSLSSVVASASLAATTMFDLLLMPKLGAIGASAASSIGYGLSLLLWIYCFRTFRPRSGFGGRTPVDDQRQ